jgi:hypothetical protein
LAAQFAAIVDRAFHVAPFDAPMLTQNAAERVLA